MRKWMSAKIKWIPENNGGRMTYVPIVSDERADNRYCPIIVFPNSIRVGESWSAIIYVKLYVDKNESIVKMSYLSENAPFELFQIGCVFELYEGCRLVATGIILEEIK